MNNLSSLLFQSPCKLLTQFEIQEVIDEINQLPLKYMLSKYETTAFFFPMTFNMSVANGYILLQPWEFTGK